MIWRDHVFNFGPVFFENFHPPHRFWAKIENMVSPDCVLCYYTPKRKIKKIWKILENFGQWKEYISLFHKRIRKQRCTEYTAKGHITVPHSQSRKSPDSWNVSREIDFAQASTRRKMTITFQWMLDHVSQ